MNTIRKIENEKLKDNSSYLLWLLLGVGGFIGIQLLNPIMKPNRYSGSLAEWLFTIIIVVILILSFLFIKRFKSITFDSIKRKITLTTLTLVRGSKTIHFDYENTTYTLSKSVSFRKGATEFVEIYNNSQKLIRLEKSVIGESSFDEICAELQRIEEKK